MPIIETLKPRDPEQLQTKIFATATGEDDVILLAVQEHLDRWGGYETCVKQTKAKTKDVKFEGDKCIVFLIMGTFMLADGKKVAKTGVAHVVEGEEGMRLGVDSAVALIYVD